MIFFLNAVKNSPLCLGQKHGGSELCSIRTFTPQMWMENFRVSRETFLYICEQLRPKIAKMDTTFRKVIPVEERVAVTLWYLATPRKYRTIAYLFGIARCIVCIIERDVCKVIVDVLSLLYIRFHTGNELLCTVSAIEAVHGVPQCVGAVDGLHISTNTPNRNHTDYYNRKLLYSVILQAVVDHGIALRILMSDGLAASMM